MAPPPRKPILYDYFSDSTSVLLAEYERSKGQAAADNVGKNRELFCNRFLKRSLPSRLTIRDGEIIDSSGNHSGQLELILLREDAPSISFGEADSYLIEGVFAVIEVKSNLNRAKLAEALRALKKVANLRIADEGVVLRTGPYLERPLVCIFAYEGATLGTLTEELSKPEFANIADLVCVLKRGSIFKNDDLLKSTDAPEYIQVPGKASALAFLYFYLVSYAGGFVAKALTIKSYFEPFDEWFEE